MNDISKLIQQHLQTTEVMQLATVRDGQPWCATVHFVADNSLNIYWCSSPQTRHSQEIRDDGRAAIAIAVKVEHPVIGVQMEGEATLVEDQNEAAKAMEAYAAKHHRDTEWAARVARGEEDWKLYRFTPRFAVLLDRSNPEHMQREWRP